MGLDLDDIHLTMGQYARYQNDVLLPKVVKSDTEPVVECGGTGICNQQTDWLRDDLYHGRYNVRYADRPISSARRYER